MKHIKYSPQIAQSGHLLSCYVSPHMNVVHFSDYISTNDIIIDSKGENDTSSQSLAFGEANPIFQ